MNFACSLVLPVPAGLKRPVKWNGSGTRAIICAASAIPAFLWMQNNRRLAFLGMRYIYVYLADFHAMIAAVAYIRIENYRIVRR